MHKDSSRCTKIIACRLRLSKTLGQAEDSEKEVQTILKQFSNLNYNIFPIRKLTCQQNCNKSDNSIFPSRLHLICLIAILMNQLAGHKLVVSLLLYFYIYSISSTDSLNQQENLLLLSQSQSLTITMCNNIHTIQELLINNNFLLVSEFYLYIKYHSQQSLE